MGHPVEDYGSHCHLANILLPSGFGRDDPGQQLIVALGGGGAVSYTHLDVYKRQVDTCMGKVVDAILQKGGVALITADHGNADQMYEPDGSAFTAVSYTHLHRPRHPHRRGAAKLQFHLPGL